MLQPGMAGMGFQGQGQQGQQGGQGNNGLWHGFDVPVDGQSPSDSWSTSSAQGQPVPSTLNVEDW
jgi:hypothetical protein